MVNVITGACEITIDPALRQRSNTEVLDNVCARCLHTTFSPLSWAHLRGETLSKRIPDEEGDDYHITDDGDQFALQIHCARESSKARGPVLSFKLTARDITVSRDEGCGFCTFLTLLDRAYGDHSLLSNGDKTVWISVQAFWPDQAGGIRLPILLNVGLHASIICQDKLMLVGLIDEHSTYDTL